MNTTFLKAKTVNVLAETKNRVHSLVIKRSRELLFSNNPDY